LNIIVLAGGLSPERNVSLSSGSLISSALRRKGHRVLMLDVYEGIKELPNDPMTLFSCESSTNKTVGDVAPSANDLDMIRKANGNRQELIGPNVITLCKMADVAFLALHGDMGENGQLQATLDVFNVTYTGSGYLGSALAMNKDIAKKLLRAEGILTPDWLRLDTSMDTDIDAVIDAIGLPAVIKPCSCGSSVGVYIVNTKEELADAIQNAAKYERFIMAESKIDGRELTCGFFDGTPLPPVEIIPKCGFYDYKNKYQSGATEEICPAPITAEQTQAIYDATAKGFEALRLGGYARFDYILDAEDRAWCLEANTLPGMTPTSLLPQEAAAVGISYDELCEKIAMMAKK
jgi:D-alanine-D-alanine ligase